MPSTSHRVAPERTWPVLASSSLMADHDRSWCNPERLRCDPEADRKMHPARGRAESRIALPRAAMPVNEDAASGVPTRPTLRVRPGGLNSIPHSDSASACGHSLRAVKGGKVPGTLRNVIPPVLLFPAWRPLFPCFPATIRARSARSAARNTASSSPPRSRWCRSCARGHISRSRGGPCR